jgi:hypothetical protein
MLVPANIDPGAARDSIGASIQSEGHGDPLDFDAHV